MNSEFELEFSDQELLEGSRETVKFIAFNQSKLLWDKGKVRKEDLQYFKWEGTNRSWEIPIPRKVAQFFIITKSTNEDNKYHHNVKRLRANSQSWFRKQLNKFDSSVILKKLASVSKEIDLTKSKIQVF